MISVVVLLFALFEGVVGQGNSGGAFTIPAIYRASPAVVDLEEILADVPANTGALEELVSGGGGDGPTPTLGQITGALDLGAVEGIDFTAPLAPISISGDIPDTIPFAFDPSTPAFTPTTPALPDAAQDIFSSFVPPTVPTGTPTNPGAPPAETPPAVTPIINLPENITGFQFGQEFNAFDNVNFGFRKGSFETVGKETLLQVNVLDDILSED